MVHINDLPFLGDDQVVLNILFSCAVHWPSYFTHSTFFFFLPISFGGFWHESYSYMWGHYGFKIMRVFSKPFDKVSSLTTNILWWYKPSFYVGLCPIFFFKELGSSGSIFMVQVSYFRFTHFGKLCFSDWRGSIPALIMLTWSVRWPSSCS
jgi:hypothetical protein